MRIALLLASYYEQFSGGAELQTKYLAQCARENGNEVHWIFVSNGAPCVNSLVLKLHPITQKNIWRKLGNVKYPYAYQVWKELKRIKPDVIYQRCALSFTGISSLYAKRYRSRLVFHIASDKEFNNVKIPIHRPYLIPEQMLMLYGIRNADIIIAQTHFQENLLKRRFNRNATKVIPNGHPIPEEIISKPKQNVNVIWVANMKPIKRPEMFLRLSKELFEMNGVSFTMVGKKGKYANMINEAIEGNNKLNVLGEIPDYGVDRLLDQGHILVNTSHQEGFNNIFIKAWMRNIPVVSLGVDPDDVIKKEGLGFCSGSYSQLVEDTKRLINDNRLRETMGKKARSYA